jgi:hypothetical protein
MNYKTLLLIIAAGFLFTRTRRKKGMMLSKNFTLDEFTSPKVQLLNDWE